MYKNIVTTSLGKNRYNITLWTDDGVEQHEFDMVIVGFVR
jgi:hypothetical protein